MRQTIQYALALAFIALFAAAAQATPAPYNKVDVVFGKSPQVLPGPVYKYTWARSDLRVTVKGTPVAPALALGSWAAFSPIKQRTWVMGDLVLLQSEVQPVVEKLESSGFRITGIHNHLIYEIPRIMYVHYMGEGDPEELAKTLKSALEQTRTPLRAVRPSAKATQIPPAWTSAVESALARKGKLHGEIYAVSVPRAETDRVEDEIVPSGMGLETALNFERIDGKVASTGDFVLIASEVNPVIKALRQHRIDVTAVHNHMLNDNPHLFFLHYWALGEPSQVGGGLKAALAYMNVKPPAGS